MMSNEIVLNSKVQHLKISTCLVMAIELLHQGWLSITLSKGADKLVAVFCNREIFLQSLDC